MSETEKRERAKEVWQEYNQIRKIWLHFLMFLWKHISMINSQFSWHIAYNLQSFNGVSIYFGMLSTIPEIKSPYQVKCSSWYY